MTEEMKSSPPAPDGAPGDWNATNDDFAALLGWARFAFRIKGIGEDNALDLLEQTLALPPHIQEEIKREDSTSDLGRSQLSAPWEPIKTAPRDGSEVLVYVAGRDGLPAFQCMCGWHSDAGWCADELREVTHWLPYFRPSLDVVRRNQDGAELAAMRKVVEAAREDLRRIYRTAEMSAAIMRDSQRTGGWEGAEKVAAQFDRIAERAQSVALALALAAKAEKL